MDHYDLKCVVDKRKGFGLISDVLNREKMGSPAHLGVMENTGRMYVNPHLILHFCYSCLQFVFPVSS